MEFNLINKTREKLTTIVNTSTIGAVIVVSYLFVGCSKINTNHFPQFTDDGNLTTKEQCLNPVLPNKIRLFVEVSGSMNGFFRSNMPTDFKTDVWSIFSDFGQSAVGVNIFSEQGIMPKTLNMVTFRNLMNQGGFVSSVSTNIPDMLSRMIGSVKSNKGEVGILVSDMKYDPVGNSSIEVLLSQYSDDIRNLLDKQNNALCVIAAKSNYLDKTGNTICKNSPYYYILVGKPEQVVALRNDMCLLLKQSNHFVDELEFGIDYKMPHFEVSNPDYLKEFTKNAYGEFSDDCNINVDFDISSLPFDFENNDSLINRLIIKTEYGTNVDKVTSKDVSYIIKNEDGNVMKRKSIARVKLHISDPGDKSEMLTFILRIPEKQIPSSTFESYLGATSVDDLSKTFSMENFLSGCFKGMKKINKNYPIYLLINK